MGWFRSAPADEGSGPPSFEDRLAQIGPGVPGHCPACDGVGYIDDIDIGHRYQIQHCKDCQHRWEYLFDGDGRVVGLTELDQDGRPVARSRIRPAASTSRLPAAPEPDVVVDVRDGVVPDADVTEPTDAAALTPGAWLRRARNP